MTRTTLWAAALGLFLFASDVCAQARFINLSNRDVFVAQWGYQPYQSRSGDLAVVTEEGWGYSGWWKVAPGETWSTGAGNYYVKDSNGPITWPNRPTSQGFITSGKFNVFLPKHSFAQKEKEILKKGYKRVTFQALGDGNWTIGNDYRLLNKKYDFDFNSRGVQFHNGSYPVPGKLSYYTVSAKEWGAKGKNWGSSASKVWVSLSTEGAQKRPFGPREKGYYSGSVTVYYTVKK